MPKLVFGGDSVDEAAGTGELLANLAKASLEPADEALPILSERLSFPIQRTAAPVAIPGGPPTPFSATLRAANRSEQAARANEAILRASSVAVGEALGKTYRPIVTLIERSTSPEDAIARVEAYCASLDPLEASDVIEKAMVAMAANGCVVAAR